MLALCARYMPGTIPPNPQSNQLWFMYYNSHYIDGNNETRGIKQLSQDHTADDVWRCKDEIQVCLISENLLSYLFKK